MQAIAGFAARLTSTPRRKGWIERLLLLLLVLAFTLPFIQQPIHHDAQLDLDWAQQQLEHPFWQHMPDYDYFGYHYDEFHDTHPRLLSFYLSIFLRLAGGVSETLLHVSMLPFPMIAALSMYSLSRRFQVNAFVATLLLLVSTAFLVNTHLIMCDIPGLSFWLAGLALFIKGVDGNRFGHMLLGGLAFTISIFIFYQGLAALPLAFLYLLLQRRIGQRQIAALAVPVFLFVAFSIAHVARYGTLPKHTYPEPVGLPFDPYLIIFRIRGIVTMLGATALLPGLGAVLFARSKAARVAVGAALLISAGWVIWLYTSDAIPVELLFLVPVFLVSGLAIVWAFVSQFVKNLWGGLKRQTGTEALFLSTWFLGVLFYCSFLMPYASPRFMLPLMPPLAILATKLIQDRWGPSGDRFVRTVSWVAPLTLVLSMSVGIAEHERASYNRIQAQFVHDQVAPTAQAQGTLWYAGYLGFQFYLKPYGYRMLMVDQNEPLKGDTIVETLYNGRWTFPGELRHRLQLIRTMDFERNWPITSFNIDSKTAWYGIMDAYAPYSFTGDFVDRLYVYRVACDQEDELDEDTQQCVAASDLFDVNEETGSDEQNEKAAREEAAGAH